jgi:class 3 adenylate cyclase/tetratricopeptide (TPR) repeat protein
MNTCPSCGTRLPGGSRFCLSCGVRIGAPADADLTLAEERKVVTTLFCDLVGFTAMSEQADPEDVDACLRSYGAAARAVIERYGGSVEKFIGDAVVGVFGVPVVHEDDAERAVRAALRLLEELAGLERPDGSPLQVRIGVNTGELVVALDADPALGDGLVRGDAINTAARLEASALPGSVIVGALTRRLTERVIAYESLPPAAAKGKARPLERWRAVRPVARVGDETSADRLSPFVGRDSELAFLVSLLRRAVDGRTPQTALVLGDPGIGKSRLVRELFSVVDAGTEMINWRRGRCVPYGEGRSLWALREIVRAHAGILESHDAGTAAELLERVVEEGPGHAWLCDRLRPLVGLDAAEAEPRQNYAAWLRFLRDAAARRPLVLIVEDLHWADEALLAFLDYVSLHASGVPLLTIATARPAVFEHHPSFAASGGRVTRMWLERLSDDETRRLVASRPEMEGSDPATVDLVVHRAEGNPFFAEELASLLAERASGTPAGAGDGALPQSVQAVIAARIDALSPPAKATLADGAVIGVRFWRGALPQPGGRDAAVVDQSLHELVDRQLLRSVRQSSLDGEDEFVFRHGMIREVAYHELPRGARAEKHAAFARWLEATVGDRARGDLSDILAGHFAAAAELARAAGDAALDAAVTDEAVDYLSAAGDRALGLDASASAQLYTRALDLAGPGHGDRAALLTRAAEALFREGRYRESATALLESAVGLSAAGDRRAAALAAARRSDVLYALGDPGVTLQLEGALSLLEGEAPCAETVAVLGRLGRALWLGGDPHGGLERIEQALEVSRALELPEPVLFLGYRGGIRCILGDVEGLDDYHEGLRLANARGLTREAALLTFNHADALLSYRGPCAAADALVAGMETARQCRLEALGARPARDGEASTGSMGEWDAETARRLTVNLVEALGMMGEWDEALARAAELLPELERSEAGSDLVIVRTQEAVLRVCRGEAQLAAPFIAWLEQRGLESEIPWIAAYALLAAAPVRAALGDADAALGLLAEWEARPRPGSGPNYVAYLPEAVRTAQAAGDDVVAGRLATGVESILPVQHNVLATLQSLMRERAGDSEAAAGFAHAAARWHEFGVPYEEGHALFGQGRCLVALGRAPEAAAPLAAAREVFARLGARPALAETGALLAGAGLAPEAGA